MWIVSFENDVSGLEAWCKAREKQILHVLRDIFVLSSHNNLGDAFPVEKVIDLVHNHLQIDNERVVKLTEENIMLRAECEQARHSVSTEIERVRTELSQRGRMERDQWQVRFDQKDKRIEELMSEMALREAKHNDQLLVCTNLQTQFQERTGAFIETYMSGGSHAKGKMAEESYEVLLNNLFPLAEIENCAKSASSCDLLLKLRENKILFEVKNYKANVPSKEVEKFKRDLVTRQCHGIMCSVSSGIARKKAFEIEVVDEQWVAIYLPHNQHGQASVELAVEFLLETEFRGLLSVDQKEKSMSKGFHIDEVKMQQLNVFLDKLIARDSELIKQMNQMTKTLQENAAMEIKNFVKTSLCA